MGKYFPVQTNQDIQVDVLIKINDITVPGLILPEILYNVKRKKDCFFIENHNSVFLDLQRGQTIGVVTSCIVKQEDLGQQSKKCRENTQSITGQSYSVYRRR